MGYSLREIAYLGGGGLLAVLCLLLPVGIAGKIILGGLVVLGSLVLALYPVRDRDNKHIDEIIWRKIAKKVKPLLYSRHGGGGLAAVRSTKQNPRLSLELIGELERTPVRPKPPWIELLPPRR